MKVSGCFLLSLSSPSGDLTLTLFSPLQAKVTLMMATRSRGLPRLLRLHQQARRRARQARRQKRQSSVLPLLTERSINEPLQRGDSHDRHAGARRLGNGNGETLCLNLCFFDLWALCGQPYSGSNPYTMGGGRHSVGEGKQRPPRRYTANSTILSGRSAISFFYLGVYYFQGTVLPSLQVGVLGKKGKNGGIHPLSGILTKKKRTSRLDVLDGGRPLCMNRP